MKTTILGTEYEGQPEFGSTAMQLHLLEKKKGTAAAQKLLDSLNTIQRVFKFPPIDISGEFTTLPDTGLSTAKAR